MIIGIITFLAAQILSRNSLFYYACGITFGVSLSVIILIYMAGKLVPRVIYNINMQQYFTSIMNNLCQDI
jgi:hypothetical protein